MRTLRVSLFLLIAASAAASADETNAPGARVTETNGPALSAVDTNSAVFNAPETNAVALREVRPVSSLDLRSFRMIWERNIFNPNRSPRFREGPPRESGTPVRTESFVLVGTMSYEKGSFAFFESGSSQYQKVLETSNTIAGYKIAGITPTHVKLESTNGQPIELRVGMEMKRRGEGDWTASERAESSGSGSRSSASSSGSSGEDSEVLKRLLQKREQDGGADAASPPSAPLVSAEKTAEEPTEKKDKAETTETGSTGGADEILKKLLQQREKELNK